MTQQQMILEHLKAYGSIDPAEAFNRLGIYRLGARIFDLRQEGHPIETIIQQRNGVRWATYRLKKPLPGEQTEERQESGNVGTNPTSEIITNH